MTSDIASPSRKMVARAYLHTATQLRTLIAEQQMSAGARLPSERELAQQLGVSRPTLREALIVLELQNEVEIRVGSGIYVKDVNASADAGSPSEQDDATQAPNSYAPHTALISASAAENSPKEVNQMRYFLESSIAADAARFMSSAQRKKLRQSLTDMQEAIARNDASTNARMAEADRLFHVTLAQSTNNQLVVQMITGLFDQRYRPIARTMHKHFDDREAWQTAVLEHEQICLAIEERDPLQAQAAMQRHLTRAHQRLMSFIG